MIAKEEIMPLSYLKMQRFTGSFRGMRYLLHKVEKEIEGTEEKKKILEAVVWPEPYSYEVTKDELKTRSEFSLDEEGRLAAIEWLDQQYTERPDDWNKRD